MLKGLLLAPLAPMRGVVWVAERLVDAAELERAAQDRAALRGQLAELEVARDRGQVTEGEYLDREQQLTDALLALRAPAQEEEDAWITP
jgi:hypothetical protein